MSKKKVAGSTMTLKDFHGGSIPSDLPLPSAPGVIPKVTTDRPWGTSIGRPDQSARPRSSHVIRNFDDKSLFLPHAANIGRNFNEDERKPLDGHSAPRRMVSDDVFRVANSRLEVKPDSGRHSGWSAAAAGPFPGKMNDVGGNGENSVLGTPANVWTGRKEALVVANNEPGRSPWTTQPAVSSLVRGSALEQVSSGRLQTKLLVPSQIGSDAFNHAEVESRGFRNNGPVVNQMAQPYVGHVEQGLVAENGIQGGKRFSRDFEKIPGPTYLEVKDAKVAANSSSIPQPKNVEVKPTGPSEVMERPKLNLLPRTKPLENVEKPVNDGKLDSNLILHDKTQKSMAVSKLGLSVAETSKEPVERPKLNLKPVTPRPEQPEVKAEKERSAVFGGARPRELVLKERGIDETEHHDLEAPLERMVIKPIERVPDHAIQRPVSSPLDLRTRKFDQKDMRSASDNARSETQRRNWRESDTKSSRQQQQTQEKTRDPSPETWRKPESSDGTKIRHRKAASALELAQAYSPFSDPKSGIGSSSFINTSRNNQTQQQPFSRLVGSTTSTPRRINGY